MSSQSTAKGFLQNIQMGKACKKNWDSDILFIRNIFAFLTLWLNPTRIDTKQESFCNPVATQCVYYMWSTMMPAALNEYILREKVRRDLAWKIKENTALNEVHDFIEKASIDQELILHIRTNHQIYRFSYSTLINMIYYFVNEEPIQNQFIQGFTAWQADAQGGWLSQPQPPQYTNVLVEQKPTECSKEVDKFTKGLYKKQRQGKENCFGRTIIRSKRFSKKHKDSEKEFENSNLKLNFKL